MADLEAPIFHSLVFLNLHVNKKLDWDLDACKYLQNSLKTFLLPFQEDFLKNYFLCKKLIQLHLLKRKHGENKKRKNFGILLNSAILTYTQEWIIVCIIYAQHCNDH